MLISDDFESKGSGSSTGWWEEEWEDPDERRELVWWRRGKGRMGQGAQDLGLDNVYIYITWIRLGAIWPLRS